MEGLNAPPPSPGQRHRNSGAPPPPALLSGVGFPLPLTWGADPAAGAALIPYLGPDSEGKWGSRAEVGALRSVGADSVWKGLRVGALSEGRGAGRPAWGPGGLDNRVGMSWGWPTALDLPRSRELAGVWGWVPVRNGVSPATLTEDGVKFRSKHCRGTLDNREESRLRGLNRTDPHGAP